MSTIGIVESYINTLSRNRELVVQLRTSALSRLVWLVGIDGFALLNAKPYWEALRGQPFTSQEIVWLSLPWALSALFGVIAHFLVDEVASKDDVYHTKKIAACELHKISLADGKADPREFVEILNDTHKDIKNERKTVDAWARWARLFELATILVLVAGFVWAVLGPSIL